MTWASQALVEATCTQTLIWLWLSGYQWMPDWVTSAIHFCILHNHVPCQCKRGTEIVQKGNWDCEIPLQTMICRCRYSWRHSQTEVVVIVKNEALDLLRDVVNGQRSLHQLVPNRAVGIGKVQPQQCQVPPASSCLSDQLGYDSNVFYTAWHIWNSLLLHWSVYIGVFQEEIPWGNCDYLEEDLAFHTEG